MFTKASDGVIGAVLSQVIVGGFEHLVVFECNTLRKFLERSCAMFRFWIQLPSPGCRQRVAFFKQHLVGLLKVTF